MSSLTSSFEIHWENMIWTSSKVRSKILLTFTKKVFHVKDRNKLQPYARHKPYAYTEYINQKRKTTKNNNQCAKHRQCAHNYATSAKNTNATRKSIFLISMKSILEEDVVIVNGHFRSTLGISGNSSPRRLFVGVSEPNKYSSHNVENQRNTKKNYLKIGNHYFLIF